MINFLAYYCQQMNFMITSNRIHFPPLLLNNPTIIIIIIIIIINIDQKERYYFKNGVHQGSPISPMLFNIYLQDFIETLQLKLQQQLNWLGYADDLVFIMDYKYLKQFLEQIAIISKQYNLEVNKKKSGIMAIKGNLEEQILEGYPIVQQYRYLGVLIDGKGTIMSHISQLHISVIYKVRKLYHLAKEMKLRQRLSLWNIYVQPLYDYSNIALNLGSKTQIKIGKTKRQSLFKKFCLLPVTTPGWFINLLQKDSEINLRTQFQKLNDKLHLREFETLLLPPVRKEQRMKINFFNNIDYIFRLAMFHCKEHEERLTHKHIIEGHFGENIEEFKECLVTNKINDNVQEKDNSRREVIIEQLLRETGIIPKD